MLNCHLILCTWASVWTVQFYSRMEISLFFLVRNWNISVSTIYPDDHSGTSGGGESEIFQRLLLRGELFFSEQIPTEVWRKLYPFRGWSAHGPHTRVSFFMASGVFFSWYFFRAAFPLLDAGLMFIPLHSVTFTIFMREDRGPIYLTYPLRAFSPLHGPNLGNVSCAGSRRRQVQLFLLRFSPCGNPHLGK